MPTIKNLDQQQYYVERTNSDVLVTDKSNMLYTWAILPARIDSNNEAVQILDALLATQITYTHDEVQAIVEGLVTDNNLSYVAVAKSFNFEWYGDFCLYAESDARFKLYVFCAGYKLYPPSQPIVGLVAEAMLDFPDEILKKAIELAERGE